MLKKLSLLVCAMLVGSPLLAQAEPIAFDQAANVTGMTGIEIGAEFDYSYEKIEEEGQSAVESTVNDIPVFVRLGFPVLEAKITIPYGSVKSNIEAAQEENYSGIRDIGIGLKTGLLGLPVFNLALGVNFTLPTGDPEKYLGEGLDFYPFLAADMDIMFAKLHANVGYEYRGEYDKEEPVDVDINTGEIIYDPVKIKPGDGTHWRLGVEVPTGGDIFTIHAELLGSTYGEVKSAGQVLEDSAGNTMTFIPGISLKKGIFKAKIGYAIPLEVQDDRPTAAPRYDWRIIGGASLCFAF
ncbi:hypothetical protein KAR34_03975 [bacterium]|nr:hypothetical protein [bacterium]